MLPALSTLLLLAGTASADNIKIGEPAPDFSLPDLDGNTVKLSDLQGKTVVLEWFNPGCPYVKYAHGDGPLSDLAAKSTEGEEVVWLAINSSAVGKQGNGLDVNKAAAAEWKMSHPILLDEDGKVGRTYDAKTTPQMFIVDVAGKVAYAGALDNAPLGKATGDTKNYIATALAEIGAQTQVSTSETKSYGCSVKY